MCRFCDYKSKDNEIFQDSLTNDWYLNVKTSEYDKENKDFIYERVYYIRFCPYCGRTLETLDQAIERFQDEYYENGIYYELDVDLDDWVEQRMNEEGMFN